MFKIRNGKIEMIQAVFGGNAGRDLAGRDQVERI
jgi:hypothetical protein